MKFNKVITTGCSFVKFLDDESCHFGNLLSSEFKLDNFVSLGHHGSSNDYSYYRVIKWLNENDVDSLLVVFGLTDHTRIHTWNNITNNHDTLWLKHRVINRLKLLQYKDEFPKLSDLESEENIKNFGDFYMKYLYNKSFLNEQIEQKLILLHNLLEKSNSKLIVFNSLDYFQPTNDKLNFLKFNGGVSNWKDKMALSKEKNSEEDFSGWIFSGHPGSKAQSWLSEKIINFLGEQNG
tara:strand:- start:100 stop:807 length:708 start_codon:yes stop_codon:yes gene_type:complete